MINDFHKRGVTQRRDAGELRQTDLIGRIRHR